MEQEVMRALLEAFERSDWQEMTVTIGGDQLHVSRQASSDWAPEVPLPAPARTEADGAAAPEATGAKTAGAKTAGAKAAAAETAAAETAAAETAAAGTAGDEASAPDGVAVTSPSVGLFWRAPAPGAPPFVEVGGMVAAGDTVAIVEVMKLMNHVAAPVAGTVVAVPVENGDAVEFGQTLVVLDPQEQ